MPLRQQATHQHSDGSSRKDTQDITTLTTSQVHCTTAWATSSDTSHLPHPRKLEIHYLYEGSHHSCHGLHRCHHNWYTFTTCTTSRRSQEDVITLEEALPLTMHLPVSAEDTLHFYRYLCTHILIADEQFLLLINVAIQDHAQQLEYIKSSI